MLPSRKCSSAVAGAATWVIQGKATVFLEEPGHDRPPQPQPRSGVSRLAPCASSSRGNRVSARRQAENIRAGPTGKGHQKGVRHQAILMPSGCNDTLKGGGSFNLRAAGSVMRNRSFPEPARAALGHSAQLMAVASTDGRHGATEAIPASGGDALISGSLQHGG